MNNMWETIADMLNVKTGQEFYLRDKHGVDKTNTYRITPEKGMEQKIGLNSWREVPLSVFNALAKKDISAYAEFKPEYGDDYFFFSVDTISKPVQLKLYCMQWRDYFSDFYNYSIGNVFRNEREAATEENVKRILDTYKKEYLKYYKPDNK